MTTSLLSLALANRFGLTFQKMLSIRIYRQLFVLSSMFVGMVALNNLTLKYLAVSFYLVGRCLTTVFNVIFSRIILNQTTSTSCKIACGIIVFGFLLGIQQENAIGGLTLIGLACGVGSSLCGSLFSIFTKKHMPLVDDSPFQLTYFNNVNASIMFLPLMVLVGEIPKLKTLLVKTIHVEGMSRVGPQVSSNSSAFVPSFTQFTMSLMISGILGFSISFVSANQIKVTSPLTHIISGTSKAYLQTVIAVAVWKERRTFLWWMSTLAVLGGSGLYAYYRSQEFEKELLLDGKVPPDIMEKPGI